jgi:penicillin-binding protein 2
MGSERRIIIQFLVVLIGVIFVAKLFAIQVKNLDYKEAAASNIIQKVIEYPYRGVFYDRHGELLVYNSPIFDLMITPRELKIPDTTRLLSLLEMEHADLKERIEKAWDYSSVKPSVFLKQVPQEQFARLQDNLIDYRGFSIVPRMKRSYTEPVFANALGYIGEISKNSLNKDSSGYYLQGDYVGISGLEKSYEEYLRGKRGEKLKLVNVRGIEKGSYENGRFDIEPLSGKNIRTTIDLELQAYAEKLMQDKVGSVVAIEPGTGEILSLTSAPSYDPNDLTGRDFGINFSLLQQDSLVPLFNRPVMADVYPPGSIFKLIQTLIALEEKVVDESTYYPCNQNLIGCHAHGSGEELMGAIQHSCNPYFYQVFRTLIERNPQNSKYEEARIGMEKWRNYLLEFGLGRELGIDIPNEKPGIIPSISYYDNVYGEKRWKFSNVYSLAIGQGELGVSPLQMANFVSIIANRGYYYIPHLVKNIEDSGIEDKYQQKIETSISREHFEFVVDAMEEVVRSGTGQYRAKLPDIIVCGKTGTVENPHGEDHSVFIAFAPKDDPKIAVSVYVENAGQGARAAAAISGLMIEKYLKRDSARLRLEDYVLAGNFFD